MRKLPMYRYRIIAFLTAFSMTASLCSCSLRSKSSSSECSQCETTAPTEPTTEKATEKATDPTVFDFLKDIPEEYKDVAKIKDLENLKEVRSHVSDLFAHLQEPDNEAAIEKDIELLLDDYDKLYEICTNKMVTYYLDWNNDKLEGEYDDADEDLGIADSLLEFAFGFGCQSKEYGYLFEELYSADDDEDIDFEGDPDYGLIRYEINSRVDTARNDDLLDEYYDIRDNTELSTDDIERRCAEIYLDILQDYDADTIYDKYYRDYTGEEILELSQTIREKLVPLDDEVWNAHLNEYDKLKEHKYYEFDNPFIIIQEKAPKLSKSIANAANTLIEEKLYYIVDDDNSYNLSFMDFLPASKKAYIYLNKANGELRTSVHEFGHYYASTYNDIPQFLATNNIDIAEIQSQGFEVLFMQLYDDIYGDEAESYKISKLNNMICTLTSSFIIGEFEYTVLKNKDTYTPDDVIKCWNDLGGDYTNHNFYDVNHIYESPGYYISYGVSALAAFDIWQDCISDKDKAVKKYENIAKISCNDKDYTFRLALKKAGFNDVLNEEYITDLSDKIMKYINEHK